MEETEAMREIEDLMDQGSLMSVLDTISAVCFAKAEHLRSNWQDENAAKAWEAAGRYMDKVSVTRTVVHVS